MPILRNVHITSIWVTSTSVEKAKDLNFIAHILLTQIILNATRCESCELITFACHPCDLFIKFDLQVKYVRCA